MPLGSPEQIVPMQPPALFGIRRSNRDFTRPTSWGKNQFNSSFPVALTCYMFSENIAPVYLHLNEGMTVEHDYISAEQLFGISPLDGELYFGFESVYAPYQVFIENSCPSVDVVIMRKSPAVPAVPLRSLEIKLTALPDQTTFALDEAHYGTELVIRPQTIAYLVLNLIAAAGENQTIIHDIFAPVCYPIRDWTDPRETIPQMRSFVDALQRFLRVTLDQQFPFMLQPVWKTVGKSPRLADQCLDVFAWSAHGLTPLFVDAALNAERRRNVTRQERTMIWVVKMLYDYARNGQFSFREIVDNITYMTRNDKAFSITGRHTHRYMRCDELTTPRVSKRAFQDIILGGGQNYLSPERRLDAIILNTPDLFD